MKLGWNQKTMLARLAKGIPLTSTELYEGLPRNNSSHNSLLEQGIIEDISTDKYKRAWVLTKLGKTVVKEKELL